MNRYEYEKKISEDLNYWKENIDYINENEIGLQRDISLCLINLSFTDYKYKKEYKKDVIFNDK